MIDFITDFGNYLKTHYPIHPLWADLLSATTLASVLTEDTFFRNNFGRNRCNLWIAYLAPSGDFKSVPIDECVIPLLRYLTSWYAKNTGQPRYFILPSIASSVEGMIKHLAEFNSRGLIYRDELTTLFKESLHKDYLTDEFELYSKFYDGIIPPRETMKFNLREPLEVYVNLVGATTPQHLYHNLSLQFFFQGCGNRWLYVRHQVPKRAYQEEELFVRDPPNWTKEELPTDLMKFADALIEASKTVVEFTIDPEAEKISTHFFNEREELRFELMKSTNPFIAEYVRRD
ncbi:MAG: hypothetical protein H5T34_00780 [Candidatus Methanomethyliales bacterium]|nr:hypothetical protein [Candidatus Methanomethylicales archaeon]